MTFIDSYLYYIKVKLLKTKDKAEEKLIVLIKHAKVEMSKQVYYFQSNSGGKYSFGQFTKYIKLKEIYYEFTNSNTFQKNSVTKHTNCTLVNTA